MCNKPLGFSNLNKPEVSQDGVEVVTLSSLRTDETNVFQWNKSPDNPRLTRSSPKYPAGCGL